MRSAQPFSQRSWAVLMTAEKAAEIYLKAAALGPVERRLDSEQLTALARRFGVEPDPEILAGGKPR